MAEVQKPIAWTTPPPGKVSSEVVGADILAMLSSAVTGRAGLTKPADIKDGEYWTKIASDGTITKYRWTLADGDTDGTPEQEILGSTIAKAGHFPLPYKNADDQVEFDQTVKDTMVGGVRKQAPQVSWLPSTAVSSESIDFDTGVDTGSIRLMTDNGNTVFVAQAQDTNEVVAFSGTYGMLFSSTGYLNGRWVLPMPRASATTVIKLTGGQSVVAPSGTWLWLGYAKGTTDGLLRETYPSGTFFSGGDTIDAGAGFALCGFLWRMF